MDFWPWLDDDDDDEDVLLAERLLPSGLDDGIATFDGLTLPPPSLVEALDLARAVPPVRGVMPDAVDHDFLAICAELANLSLPVIFLPGKGRTRTGPLTHWPRRSARNAASGSQRRRKSCARAAEKVVGQQMRNSRTLRTTRRAAKRTHLVGPVMTPELAAAVAEAQADRAARICKAQAMTASLAVATRKRVRF